MSALTKHDVDDAMQGWLAAYKETHRGLLDQDQEFAQWLEEEYTPIAGGWLY